MENIRTTYKNAMIVIEKELNRFIFEIECELKSEFIFINSDIDYDLIPNLKTHLNWIKNNKKYNDLTVMIHSRGGKAEVVYELVPMIREGYDKVRFVIPDKALSAASLFCLSGDEIYISFLGKMGDLRLQLSDGKYHYPFTAYLENEYNSIEKDYRLTPEMKGFISRLKERLEIKSNQNAQKKIKETMMLYLKTYMFKEYMSLLDFEKERINQIPNKLTDWEYLNKMGCITHDTGIYYEKLKNQIGIKICEYINGINNKKLSEALANFDYLIIDYRLMNAIDNYFVYSKYINEIEFRKEKTL